METGQKADEHEEYLGQLVDFILLFFLD